MKLKDTLTLIGSKLKIRKLRTTITIITSSMLFGIIIAVLFVAHSFFDGMVYSATINSDGFTQFIVSYPIANFDTPETQAETIRLYNESNDPNKEYPIFTLEPNYDLDGNIAFEWPPMLVQGNPFTLAAITPRKTQLDQEAKVKITQHIQPYQAKAVSYLSDYSLDDATISIDELEEASQFGSDVAVVDKSAVASLVKLNTQKNNVVQILIPLNRAAQLLDINAPKWSTPSSAVILQDYIQTVNKQAIGHQFTATITKNEQTTEITYEIVGLLPPVPTGSVKAPLSTIKYGHDKNNDNLNPLEIIVYNLQENTFYPYDFIVVNPDSTAFAASYRYMFSDSINHTNVIVSFDDIRSATAFKADIGNICLNIDDGIEDCRTIGVSDFISNQTEVQSSANFANITISATTTIFTIVAAIIMAGTVSRVVSDEHQTIALYRAVGASTKNILQVFCAYILTLCLFIIICATVIGLILSGIITIINTAVITANVAAMHNVPDLAPIIFIGFDPRILLIYLTIIAIGALCLFLVLSKLATKNIVKDLRKA